MFLPDLVGLVNRDQTVLIVVQHFELDLVYKITMMGTAYETIAVASRSCPAKI